MNTFPNPPKDIDSCRKQLSYLYLVFPFYLNSLFLYFIKSKHLNNQTLTSSRHQCDSSVYVLHIFLKDYSISFFMNTEEQPSSWRGAAAGNSFCILLYFYISQRLYFCISQILYFVKSRNWTLRGSSLAAGNGAAAGNNLCISIVQFCISVFLRFCISSKAETGH